MRQVSEAKTQFNKEYGNDDLIKPMFSDKYCLNMSDNLLDTMMKLDKINSSVKLNFVKLDLSSTSSSVRIMLSMSTLK